MFLYHVHINMSMVENPLEDLKFRVSGGLKIVNAIKMMCDVKCVSLRVKKELCERVVGSTVTFEAETLGVREGHTKHGYYADEVYVTYEE